MSVPRPAAAPRKEPQALHLPPATRSPLRALGWPAPSPGCLLPAGSGEGSAEPRARRCRSCSRSRYRTSASRADSSSKRTRDGDGPRGRRGRPQLESPLDESLRLPPSRGAMLGLPLGSLPWGQTDGRRRAAGAARQPWESRAGGGKPRRGKGGKPAQCSPAAYSPASPQPEAEIRRGCDTFLLPRLDLQRPLPAPRCVVNHSENTTSHMTWHTWRDAAVVQPPAAILSRENIPPQLGTAVPPPLLPICVIIKHN